MKFLADTNIFLELILDQAQSSEAKDFLAQAEKHELYLTDFSLRSIGIILFQRNLHFIFQRFLEDVIVNMGMIIVALSLDDMDQIVDAARKYDLDFDDAYQYAAAEKHDLVVVSFDDDFDRTARGRTTPAQIITKRVPLPRKKPGP